MNINDYLVKYQLPLYQTFVNQMNSGHLSHAYLINGEPGTPLKEVAKFLASSLVCEEPHPLACQHCLECHRIDDGSYVDFYLFDGDEGTIKKENILSLEAAFSQTSVEKAGKLIYVIHKVEKMTPEAINSLLKFLEEPNENVFAFLTTENEARVLATIISRVQNLPLKLIPRDTLIKEALELGVGKEDAELLSLKYNLAPLIQTLQNDVTYLNIKNTLFTVLDQLALSLEEGILASMKVANNALSNKEDSKFYLQMLVAVFQDIVNYNLQGKLLLSSMEEKIVRLAKVIKNPLTAIKVTLDSINRIESNVNLSLLLDHVMINLSKERST